MEEGKGMGEGIEGGKKGRERVKKRKGEGGRKRKGEWKMSEYAKSYLSAACLSGCPLGLSVPKSIS